MITSRPIGTPGTKDLPVEEAQPKRLGYDARQYRRFKTYAWRALLGFSILYAFLYCGRFSLSSAMPLMIDQEGWTAADLGILSSIFFWTYAIGHLVNGRLGEIVGVSRFIVLAVILSAVANILVGISGSIVVIAVLWGLNGFFQSMAWAPGMSLLSKWWPSSSRGFATGIANGLSGFGQAIAVVAVMVSFAVAPQLGWRAAFLFPMLAAVALAVIYALVVKDRPSRIGLADYVDDCPASHADDERRMAEEASGKGRLFPYRYLLSQPTFDIWLVIIAAASIARYGLLTWIPLYFTTTLGMDIQSGLLGTPLLPIGMGVGTIVIPTLTDRFCRDDRLPAVILCALVGGVSVLALMLTRSMLAISVLLFVAGFFLYAINGLVWTFAIDAGGRQFSGTASGVLDFAAYVGASVQALVFGFSVSGGNWTLLFLTVAGVCALMALLAVIARHVSCAGQHAPATPSGTTADHEQPLASASATRC